MLYRVFSKTNIVNGWMMCFLGGSIVLFIVRNPFVEDQHRLSEDTVVRAFNAKMDYFLVI